MKKGFVTALMTVLVVLGAATVSHCAAAQQTPAPAAAALTGAVRSAKEGPMEGVLVSVKRDGSTITTTVVTNAQGAYSFPRARWRRADTASPFVPSATSWTPPLPGFL